MGLGALTDGLAPTPPMGWNSWNRFGPFVSDQLVRETADALIESGMRDAGYRYVVIDDAWEGSLRSDDGQLEPNLWRFPNMHGLAAYLHKRDLKFGLYTCAGDRTCQGYPGSRGREFVDARRFASWDVDFMKIDWCHSVGLDARAAYATWSEAIRATRRPMVLSICEWGRNRPWEWAGIVGHLWRTSHDIADTWDSLVDILDRQADLADFAGPDHWNDPDMLEVGNGGMTDAEYRAHFSLWAILAAPLMAGNDVRSMTDGARARRRCTRDRAPPSRRDLGTRRGHLGSRGRLALAYRVRARSLGAPGRGPSYGGLRRHARAALCGDAEGDARQGLRLAHAPVVQSRVRNRCEPPRRERAPDAHRSDHETEKEAFRCAPAQPEGPAQRAW